MSLHRKLAWVLMAPWALLAVGSAAVAQSADHAQAQREVRPPRDVRFVVIHTPGPKWLPGKSLFEQPGLKEHVAHYQKLLDAGKLVLGGPHLDDRGGGMMIPASGVPQAEITQFAAEDPAVRSGLLVAEVRPWLIGMRP